MTRGEPRFLIVAGSYRSGTTWISNTLAQAFTAEHNFEPLEPSYTTEVRRLQLRNRYLRPNQVYPEETAFLERLVNGRLYRLPIKTMSRNPMFFFRWKWWRHRKLSKLIQGHLLLPYLKVQFDVPIIFVIRHPCGVIESLTRQRWWNSDLHEFLDGRNQELWEDNPTLYNRTQKALSLLRTPVETDETLLDREERVKRTAIRWCIENAFALEVAPRYGFITVEYESFYRSPQKMIRYLADVLGIQEYAIPQSIAQPSARTSCDSPLHDPTQNPVSYWKSHLTNAEISLILQLTANFHIVRGVDGQ